MIFLQRQLAASKYYVNMMLFNSALLLGINRPKFVLAQWKKKHIRKKIENMMPKSE